LIPVFVAGVVGDSWSLTGSWFEFLFVACAFGDLQESAFDSCLLLEIPGHLQIGVCAFGSEATRRHVGDLQGLTGTYRDLQELLLISCFVACAFGSEATRRHVGRCPSCWRTIVFQALSNLCEGHSLSGVVRVVGGP